MEHFNKLDRHKPMTRWTQVLKELDDATVMPLSIILYLLW